MLKNHFMNFEIFQEIHDINIILSAVLHLGNIEFEDGDNDCVVIRDEDVVHKGKIRIKTE